MSKWSKRPAKSFRKTTLLQFWQKFDTFVRYRPTKHCFLPQNCQIFAKNDMWKHVNTHLGPYEPIKVQKMKVFKNLKIGQKWAFWDPNLWTFYREMISSHNP